MPPLRDRPLSIAPLHDYEVVISDEQLHRILMRLRPRLEGDRTLIPNVDHAFRLWGSEADFGDPRFISGREMLWILTDHRRFQQLYGPEQPSLLISEDTGVRYRLQEGVATCSHPDHTAACLAESGLPLDFPIVTPAGETTYRAVIEQSLRDFRFNQVEYEWSVKLFAMFLPPATQWQTETGQQLSFDRLADRVMREPLRRGVCFGQHRLYGLVALLRIDQQTPILSPATRERIADFLTNATRVLVQHQHPDGFWNDRWTVSVPESWEPTERDGDSLGDRILVTGHVLEWWAMAPAEYHPPRATLVSAGQWLVRTLDSISDEHLQQNYAYSSHAGLALAAWRNRRPYEVISSGR
jgi:hypothetical protein